MNTKLLRNFMVTLLSLLSVQAGAQDSGVQLGQGFEQSTSTFLKSCLKYGGDHEWYNHVSPTNSQSDIEFKQVGSYDELLSLLDIVGELSLGTAKFSGKASGGYGTSLNTSSNTLHIIYKFEIHNTTSLDLDLEQYSAKQELLDSQGKRDVAAKDALLSTVAKYYSTDPAKFIKTCGDRFVETADGMGLLLVDIVVTFKSTEDRENFDLTLQAGGGSGSISLGVGAALNMAENKDSKATSITITGKQFGGDPSQLSSIFLGKVEDGYAVTRCGSGGGQEACEKLIDGIIDYGAKAFPDQFKYHHDVFDKLNMDRVVHNTGDMDFTKLFYSSPNTTLYTKYFGELGPNKFESGKMISEMFENYDKLDKDLIKIDEYVARVGDRKPKPSGVEDLENLRTKLTKEKAAYVPAIGKGGNTFMKSCVEEFNLEACQQSEDYIKAKHEEAFRGPQDAKDIEEREYAMLEALEVKNFSIKLATLADVKDSKSPKFNITSCRLIPLAVGLEAPSMLDCPAIGSGNDAIIETKPSDTTDITEIEYVEPDSSSGIAMPAFVYGLRKGDKKYCFKYPALTLNYAGLGEYAAGSRDAPSEILYKAVSVNDFCPSVDGFFGGAKIENSNWSNRPPAHSVSIRRQGLSTVYPNIARK